MNKTAFFVATSALLVLAPGARAQTPAPAATPAAPAAPAAQGAPAAVRATAPIARALPGAASVYTIAMAGPAWLEQKVDVDVKNASVLDAVKRVLDAAKVNAPKVETQFDLPKNVTLSLEVKNVPARDALAAVARLGGAVAYVAEEDGKTSVVLRSRSTAGTIAPPVLIGPNGPKVSVDMDRQIRSAMRQAETAAARGQNGFYSSLVSLGARLPDKRVSLDVRNADLRDSLKNVLKQAELDYALEDEIPDDKKSFTFEKLPIATALDVICQSAGVGWRAELTPASADNKKERKVIVRVSKRYANRRLGTTDSFYNRLLPFVEHAEPVHTLYDYVEPIHGIIEPAFDGESVIGPLFEEASVTPEVSNVVLVGTRTE